MDTKLLLVPVPLAPTTSNSLKSPFSVPLTVKLLRDILTGLVSHHPGLASLEGLEA